MTYGPLFRVRERIIEPVGEARHGFFILAELAERLGYGHLYPQTEEALLRHALKPSGFTLDKVRAAGGVARILTVMMEYKKWEKGRLRADGLPGFETPTGKFEIASTILEEHGHDPLPVYTEPKEGPLAQPELAKRFPLVFNSGSRTTTDFRSQFHNIPDLVRERPGPTVLMNRLDAEARNIGQGDLVRVVTPRGGVAFRALVSDDIMQGVIDADMGGGGPVGPQEWQDCNVNELTDLQRYDPISGFPVYKALLCDIVKMDGTAAAIVGSAAEFQPSITVEDVSETLSQRKLIYLDHNATTPVDPEVAQTIIQCTEKCFGNASSIHVPGNEARLIIESARRQVAQLINCTARRIVFTSGGSESDNFAIKGIAFARRDRGNHIITTTIEHPAVLNTCNWLEQQGFVVTKLEVNRDGLAEVDDLKAAMTPGTILVSIMAANNETGAIQPIIELTEVAHSGGALFHTDAVQAVGKIATDVQQWNVDLLTLSGHKFHGPKGVGAFYIRQGIELDPLVHGGKQEHGLRAGTENVPGIAGLGMAAQLAIQRLPEMSRIRTLRDRLETGIQRIVPDAKRNGPEEERLPNTLNITLPGMRGESVVLALDQRGVALSSGSACRAGSPEPSHALLAMGLSPEEAHCALRFSLGIENTEEEIDRTLGLMEQMISDTAASVRFVPCR
jgi:cysteine desulfurase NifS